MKQEPPSTEGRLVNEPAECLKHRNKRKGASDRSRGRKLSARRVGATPGRMECGENGEAAACRVARPRDGGIGAVFGYMRERASIRRFLCSTRAGATAYVGAAVALMTVLGGALITDHVWLIDKRDLLKNSATAASLTATAELGRLPLSMADVDVEKHLKGVVHNYVWINVKANTRSDLQPDDVVVRLDIDRAAGVVNAAVEAPIGETLFSFLHSGPKTVRQATASEQQFQAAEVVLAIDTSGSMNSDLEGRGGRSRLDIVKEAANNLINALAPDESGPVALGLVPWTGVVRLHPETRRQWQRHGWVDFPSRRSYLVPYICRPSPRCTPEAVVQNIPRDVRGYWHGCIDESRILEGVTQVPSMENALELPSRTAFAESYFMPQGGVYARAYQCLGDTVPDNFDAQYCWSEPSPDNRQFKTVKPQGACSGVRNMIPLTNDTDAIRRSVNALAAPGRATYSALGIQWGRRMLSPAWREIWGAGTHPLNADSGVPKIIVLLTDGGDTVCGTRDPECESGLAVGRAEACEAAKADGIEIFVVAAMAPELVSRDLGTALRACASSPEHAYINNPDAEALLDAFRSIATELVSLKRIS